MLNYGHVRWRYELAKMLAEAERITEAMQEAKTCLQLRPQFKGAKKLVEDLSVHPVLFSSSPSPSDS
jgi:hypothetical protein